MTMAVRAPVELDRGRIRELIEREGALLNERTAGSRRMYERARATLVGGVASSYQVRDPWPIYLSHGRVRMTVTKIWCNSSKR